MALDSGNEPKIDAPDASTHDEPATEATMGVFSALKLYPKAAAWSVFFSLGVIMTGFGPQVMGNLYGVPKFQRDFGYLFEGAWIISAPWQAGLGCVQEGIGYGSI
jgi:hypothetical protein